MTILLQNNINPLMQQSVQYLLISHLSPTQTNWMVREHATYNSPCEKHDVLKSKLQTDRLALRLIDCLCTITTTVEDSRRLWLANPLFYPCRWRAGRPLIAVACAGELVFFFWGGYSFALGRAITIAPASSLFSVCVIPNADSVLYAIVVCRTFDPRLLVDLVCVSPRVVSTRHF
jgi:hypothetical protein